MKTIIKICQYCQQEFNAPLKEHNRGYAKFCTSKCSYAFRKGTKKTTINNCICAFCKSSFYRSKSKMKLSKSGFYFCSRKCKDLGQRIDSNISEIWPNHFGTGKCTYRDKAKNYLDVSKCSLCGFNTTPQILEIHHIDRNRDNNSFSNLQVLCPNCHQTIHFNTSSGRYTKNK